MFPNFPLISFLNVWTKTILPQLLPTLGNLSKISVSHLQESRSRVIKWAKWSLNSPFLRHTVNFTQTYGLHRHGGTLSEKVVFFCNFDNLLQASLTKKIIKPLHF